ncbi:NAC transcription factor 56-like [Abeliophyllum distichum]|uniref:NAC transcription factor 56-like n=1 Tax=Abeliophyllum distichum TaxID=126358 RepID=A0ABD1VBH2_9LAMI
MVNQPIQNNGVLYPNFLDEVSDDEYFRSIPVGFRFKPTHDELIVDYLMKKIKNEKLPRNNITSVNIYEFNPEILVDYFRLTGEDEWYFFTPREKKYKNGKRPNRAAGTGYWKATGADNIVKRNGENVGCRKSLVFYEGKPSNGAKTSWIMHEYTVNNPPIPQKSSSDDMRVNLSIYTSSLHVFRVEALMSCLVYNISSVFIYNVVQIVSCSWTIWFCVESKTTRKVTKIESEKGDDQTEETNNNTNEGANYEESKRREGENTINVAAREDHFWSFDNIDLAIADSFLGNGENMMGDVNDYNPYGVFNYQNTQYTHIDSIPLHDNNQAPVSIVPPNYSMEPYIYGQYPVGYMPDVTGQHQELPGFPKMDNIGGLLGSVAGGHALAPTT